MAYGSAALSATMLARLDDDRPIILGSHRIAEEAPTTQWRESGSFAAGSSAADPNGPVSYLYDYQPHLRSKPASSETLWYVIIDFGSDLVDFDSVAIINHNFGTAGDVTAKLQIADDNAFTSNKIDLCTFSPVAHNKRLVSVELMHTGTDAREYTDVRYARLEIASTGGFVPEIGELILGSRVQLEAYPDEPWNPDYFVSTIDGDDTDTGIDIGRARRKGQKLLDAHWTMDDTDVESDIVAWFKTDTDFGTHPWLWIPHPGTDPQDAAWMKLDDPVLDFPYTSATNRTLSLVAHEIGTQFVGRES